MLHLYCYHTLHVNRQSFGTYDNCVQCDHQSMNCARIRHRPRRRIAPVGRIAAQHPSLRHRVRSWRSDRADRESQVRQCLGFCSADSQANEDKKSAVQKPKHCLSNLRLPIISGDQTEGEREMAIYNSMTIYRGQMKLLWIRSE